MRNEYPASREADVILRDGSTVHVRPVREETGRCWQTSSAG